MTPRKSTAGSVPIDGAEGERLDGARAKRRGRSDEVIDVAATMFFEDGFDGTSLQDVADKLGMLKGSLYYYMKSKDDLLYEVILRSHHSALALVRECQAMDAPPETKLIALVRGYADSLANGQIFASVYLRDLDRLSEERRQQIIDGRRAYQDFVESLLEEGRRSGALRSDLNARLSALAILGMLNSSYRWFRPNGPIKPEQLVDELLNLVLRGLLPRDTIAASAGASVPRVRSGTAGAKTPPLE